MNFRRAIPSFVRVRSTWFRGHDFEFSRSERRDIVVVRKLFIRFNVFQIRFLWKRADNFFLRVYKRLRIRALSSDALVAPSLLLRGLPTFRMFDTLMRPPLCFWVVEMKYFFERKFVCELYISIFLDLIFLKQWCFNRIWIFLRLFWIMVFSLNFNFNLLIINCSF